MATISDYLNECELEDLLQELQKQSYGEEGAVQVHGSNKNIAIDCFDGITRTESVDLLETTVDEADLCQTSVASGSTSNAMGLKQCEESTQSVVSENVNGKEQSYLNLYLQSRSMHIVLHTQLDD
jgi:hypothetical protein